MKTVPVVQHSEAIPSFIADLLNSIQVIETTERSLDASNAEASPPCEFSILYRNVTVYERSLFVARPEGFAEAQKATAKKKDEPTTVQVAVEEAAKPQFEEQTEEVVALAEMMRRKVNVSWLEHSSDKVGMVRTVSYEQGKPGGHIESKTRHYYKAPKPTNKTYHVTNRDVGIMSVDIHEFLKFGIFPA